MFANLEQAVEAVETQNLTEEHHDSGVSEAA
jgi:hypothetical protein